MIEKVTEGCAVTSPDGHILAEHYEALRREALGGHDTHTRVRGLAFLMRHGMAAWMKGVSEIPACGTSLTATAAITKLPETLEQSLIDIMATMAFATAMEVCDESRDLLESTATASEEKRLPVRATVFAATSVREQ